MKKDKLLPKPNRDLRVTRWIEWIVDRIPVMSYAKYRKLQVEIYNQHRYIQELHAEYFRIMQDLPIPRAYVESYQDQHVDKQEMIHTTRVTFEPMNIATAISRHELEDLRESNQLVKDLIRSHSRHLAQAHSERMEQEIYAHNMKHMGLRP